MTSVAGVYQYQRVGHDQREIELLDDGSIGRGAAGAERRWELQRVEGACRLSLYGEYGEICRLVPDRDGIWRGCWRKFERMPVQLVPQRAVEVDSFLRQGTGSELASPAIGPWSVAAGTSTSISGRYTYRRVFHEDRPMQLLADGTIGEGAAGCEQRWEFKRSLLEISGNDGVICRLKLDGDGVWRGTWTQHGRMPIELFPEGAFIPPMPRGSAPFRFPVGSGFWWSNTETLAKAVRKICQQLPPLKAVAGIPRAGIIPAALIAQWQNIPLLDIDEALVASPRLPSYRRRSANDIDPRLPILIVDDTVCSGRMMSWYRSRAIGKGNFLFAAPYVDQGSFSLVDFYAEEHPRCNQAFEWNLLHEATNTDRLLCDLDGVICEDWTGGNEDHNPDAYRRHLEEAKPLRLPTKKLRGIVTGRLQIYREQTEAWLGRHGVTYQELRMIPASTLREREQIGPANFKARVFAQSDVPLFVESCPDQARQIHHLTRKPVIDFTNMIAHGATLFR